MVVKFGPTACFLAHTLTYVEVCQILQFFRELNHTIMRQEGAFRPRDDQVVWTLELSGAKIEITATVIERLVKADMPAKFLKSVENLPEAWVGRFRNWDMHVAFDSIYYQSDALLFKAKFG
jgi:hypothetical protein